MCRKTPEGPSNTGIGALGNYRLRSMRTNVRYAFVITLMKLLVILVMASTAWGQSASTGGWMLQGVSGPAVQSPAPPSLVSVAVTPSAPTQTAGAAVAFTATGTYSDGSSQNLTNSATWSSGNNSVATLGALTTTQAVNCMAGGTSVIRAASGAISGQTTLTCQAPQICTPPSYCASTSIATIDYAEALHAVPTAPLLNVSYTDPAFNRKIWRWTDGTIAPSPCAQHSMGLRWDAGDFSGAWNQLSNALIVTADCGYSTVLKVNTSNPNAPSVGLWSCTDSTTGLCHSGQIQLYNNAAFANTSNYLVFYDSNDGKLSKADFTANYSNPAAAPVVTSPWFDPYATGNCAAGITRPNGGVQPIVTSDDQYFTGFTAKANNNQIVVWHAGDANCTLLDFSTANWVVSGVGQQGGGTFTFSWVGENNAPTTSPGTGCVLHGAWYDQVTNSIVITLQQSSCSGLDSQDHGVIANLTTHVAFVGSLHQFAGGHGLGQVLTIGTASYICNGDFPSTGAGSHEYCNSYALPSTANSWFDFPSGVDYSHWPGDYHTGGLWTGAFPTYHIGSATGNPSASPPASTLAAINYPDNEELDLFVIAAAASPSTAKLYRYVHLYDAVANYNSTGAYSSLVGPQIAPNKCWAVFPSNWYGNLGTTGARSTACTSGTTGSCAYDVFAVYLCGGPGT